MATLEKSAGGGNIHGFEEWINGGSNYSGTVNDTWDTTDQRTAVGDRGDTGITPQFDGIIAEVFAFNRVLSVSEINQLAGEYIPDKWGITWTTIT